MFLVETIFEQQPPQVIQASQVEQQPVPVDQNGQPIQQEIPVDQNGQPIQAAPEDQGVELSPDDYDEDLDAEDTGEVGPDGQPVQQPAFPQELLPIKRYYLLEKIRLLKTRLDDHNIQNDDLDTILKFSNQLSYNSLTSLMASLLPVIEEQIVRLNNASQTVNTQEV